MALLLVSKNNCNKIRRGIFRAFFIILLLNLKHQEDFSIDGDPGSPGIIYLQAYQ
ncbi:hypothetical protein Ga0466249_003602 [Sporomusaceae bacterium BoRhaA]|nr:hypothetical protein [Pelorhabdus rhamnosifermentans]